MDLEALMGALLAGDDRRIADQRVVNTRVRHQVGLELIQVDIERAIEAQAGSDGADNLSDEAVEMLIAGTRNVQVAAADVVDSLIVDEECAVRVLNRAVGGKHRIVGLDDGGRDARSWVDGEFELGLLAVVGGEALEEESTEAGASATAEGVEDKEALEGRAVV